MLSSPLLLGSFVATLGSSFGNSIGHLRKAFTPFTPLLVFKLMQLSMLGHYTNNTFS
jgi:hypothetical protein